MIRSFYWGTLLLFISATSFGVTTPPAETVDSIMYKNWAREANSKHFIAELAIGAAQVHVERSQFQLDLRTRLLRRNAASPLEYSESVMALMKAKFELKRAQATAYESENHERIWNLRARWARNGEVGSPKEIARIYASTRKRYLELGESLVTDASALADQLTGKLRSLTQAGYQAISQEEFQEAKLVADATNGLVAAARARLPEARRLWEDADKESK